MGSNVVKIPTDWQEASTQGQFVEDKETERKSIHFSIVSIENEETKEMR